MAFTMSLEVTLPPPPSPPSVPSTPKTPKGNRAATLLEEAMLAGKARRGRVAALAQQFDEVAIISSAPRSWEAVKERTAQGLELCETVERGAQELSSKLPAAQRAQIAPLLGGIARLRIQWKERQAPLDAAIKDARAASKTLKEGIAALDDDLAKAHEAAARDLAACREECAATVAQVEADRDAAVARASGASEETCAYADAYLAEAKEKLERKANERLKQRMKEVEAEVTARLENEQAALRRSLAEQKEAMLNEVAEKESMALQLAAEREQRAFEAAEAKERAAMEAAALKETLAEEKARNALNAASDKEIAAIKLVSQERELSIKVRNHQKFLDEQVDHARVIQSLHAGSSYAELQTMIGALTAQLQEKNAALTSKEKELRDLMNSPHIRRTADSPEILSANASPLSQRSAQMNASVSGVSEFEISGELTLGGALQVVDVSGTSPQDASFQWFRVLPNRKRVHMIGACSAQYAPEPQDTGCIVGCSVTRHESTVDAVSHTPIAAVDGQDQYLKALLRTGSASFRVQLVASNGKATDAPPEVHSLEIGPDKIKLKRSGGGVGSKARIKDAYAPGMVVCGARSVGDIAPRSLFLQIAPGNSVVLVLETPRERNVCIEVLRRLGADKGMVPGGPEDAALGIV